MSLKYSYTTADYLAWNEMTGLIRRLYADGNYTISLLLACGSFWGLRISDLRNLTWEKILGQDTLIVVERKTGKRRVITVNKSLQKHIRACYSALGRPSRAQYCFISRMGTVYSVQRLNGIFKELKIKYHLSIEHFSTHSMRKSFGRQIVDKAGTNAEMALIKLSEIFGHSSPAITRRYLGLRQQEIQETYNSLTF